MSKSICTSTKCTSIQFQTRTGQKKKKKTTTSKHMEKRKKNHMHVQINFLYVVTGKEYPEVMLYHP